MIEALQSLQWLDYYYYALVGPRNLVDCLRRGLLEPLFMSILSVCIIVIVEIITISLLSLQTPVFYYKISYGWMILSSVTMFYLLIISSLIDCACQFAGYQGRVREIFMLVSFSLFPRILLLPLVYIFKVFSFLPVLIYILASLGLYGWSALIVIQGLSEIHKAGFSKAVLLFAFPFILFGGVAILSLVLFAIGLSGYISFL